MGQSISFWVLAVIAVAAALGVVLLRSVFRSALGLILCFLAVAGIFVTLNADFLAAVQVLIYVGAVAVLIVLAVMLTREVERGNVPNKLGIPVLITSALFLGVSAWAVLTTSWPQNKALPVEPTAGALGYLLFGQDGFVLIVEIAAMVILATIIGAISITREK